MGAKVYLNGDLIDATRAFVHISNPSFLRGVGLFETLRSYHGRPLRLEQHIERMKTSAAALKMPIGDALDCIPEAIRAVLEANKLSDARIRFTITPPDTQDESGRPVILVTAEPATGYGPELYEKGMTVRVCTDYRQSAHDPLAGHKTTSYFSRLIALRDAQEHKCAEALWFTPQNHLAEGSISNIFLVKGGRLRTPPLDTPVLPGVTRASVLELAQEHDIPTDESPSDINDLLDADEVFLTNAVMQIMPVTHIERKPIADEKPGPITQQLAAAYHELTVS